MAVFGRPFNGGSDVNGAFDGRDNPWIPGPRRIELGAVADPETRRVVAEAVADAQRRGPHAVGSLHILRALAGHGRVAALLHAAGASPESLSARAGELLDADATETGQAAPESPDTGSAETRNAGAGAPVLGAEASAVLAESLRAARALGSQRIAPEHALVALVMSPGLPAGRLLAEADITPERLHRAAMGQPAGDAAASDPSTHGAGRDGSATPTLDKYGTDLTARARDGGFDAVIGRSDEITQTVEILLRRTKNNPVLVGEAGVGKTAIVEGLAQRIADGDVPEPLLDRRVVQLDLPGMLAGARYRGDFEERMTKVIDELTASGGETIVFLDELHTIVGAGGADGAVDAGNMLKPALARGTLHLIGATTLDEYRTHVEKDPALERRLQPVAVDEPSPEDTVAILHGLAPAYESHHGVEYTDGALRAAVELSRRYLPDRRLPDKAIDLLDQAGARMRLSVVDPGALARRIAALTEEKERAVAAEDYEAAGALRDRIAAVERRAGGGVPASGTEKQPPADPQPDDAPPAVTEEDIAAVVSRATGVPATRMTGHERGRLARLEDELHGRVVGQDDAVRAVARAVRRSRTGMADPGRPVGSFLFLGPTGVGKTELAKALAASVYGSEDNLVRLDMSEFGERHTASRMVGSPPGYVGYGEAGQLTEKVRRNPYSVILLDEIEKAHPDVFNVLLQVLDDGRLTDGQGRTVDFTHTVLIMTSNLGSEYISSRSGGIGFAPAAGGDGGQDSAREKALRDKVMGRLRESFRPEFLNRIDDVVVFRKLDAAQLHRITAQLLAASREKLAARDIGIEFTDAVIDWLAARGHEPEYGARPLRRTIARELDDRIADLLIADRVPDGGTVAVAVDAAGDELVVTPS